ncbi:hypothetical protein OHA72_32660 [Dactylosporangium sp. NBC_01737]|uniref:hypothetical protein n=1 Tax=Dactylosporangium sp. NBC_01737 TaxID=2975959 RepID=UPI002E11F4C7|nr:hypothetical protein OHA72_32660 [Dactylosporangium sp. NBC_01737]
MAGWRPRRQRRGGGRDRGLGGEPPRDAFALLLAAVSAEVAAFAVSQAVALRRAGAPRNG